MKRVSILCLALTVCVLPARAMAAPRHPAAPTGLAMRGGLGLRVASGQDRAKAKRHFDRGEKLFAVGRFDEALTEYQAAYDAAPLPGFLFNIGQCYRNLGDFEAAIFSFEKYLADAPDASNRDAVEEYITELRREQAAREARETPPPANPERDGSLLGRWWFWTGVAVVVGAGATTAYVLTRDDGELPPTTFGNIDFGR